MDQCFIITSPDVGELQNRLFPGYSRDLTKVDWNSVLLSQAKTKLAQRKANVEPFVARFCQMRKYEYLSYRHDYCYTSEGYFVLRMTSKNATY